MKAIILIVLGIFLSNVELFSQSIRNDSLTYDYSKPAMYEGGNEALYRFIKKNLRFNGPNFYKVSCVRYRVKFDIDTLGNIIN